MEKNIEELIDFEESDKMAIPCRKCGRTSISIDYLCSDCIEKYRFESEMNTVKAFMLVGMMVMAFIFAFAIYDAAKAINEGNKRIENAKLQIAYHQGVLCGMLMVHDGYVTSCEEF